jgi:hypothetical protein
VGKRCELAVQTARALASARLVDDALCMLLLLHSEAALVKQNIALHTKPV